MAPPLPADRTRIETLLAIMARLRDPDGGCPWDLEQTFETIAPYTLEEAYEVADAIERGDMDDLKDELGDLLLQVVFHARIAEDDGTFNFGDVVDAISSKMIRRHPHVFGDGDADTPQAVKGSWERIKATERDAKAGAEPARTLDGIPKALPALVRAVKLQKRAARVGFDWPQTAQVLDKLVEETNELKVEIDAGAAPERVMDELGDILFVYANLARHLDVDPEQALSGTNAKFESRFKLIEDWLREDGRTPEQSSLEEMDALWNRAKAHQRSGQQD